MHLVYTTDTTNTMSSAIRCVFLHYSLVSQNNKTYHNSVENSEKFEGIFPPNADLSPSLKLLRHEPWILFIYDDE